MREWLLQLDSKMGNKSEFFFVLDNAGSHPHEVKLQNIEIILLPPNSTSMSMSTSRSGYQTEFQILLSKLNTLTHIIKTGERRLRSRA